MSYKNLRTLIFYLLKPNTLALWSTPIFRVDGIVIVPDELYLGWNYISSSWFYTTHTHNTILYMMVKNEFPLLVGILLGNQM